MISTLQLKSISNLFQDRERQLANIIGNLQYEEVKTDLALCSTIKQIENELLLEQVVIGDPKIVANRSEEQMLLPNYHFRQAQNVQIITVEYPYTGSAELFLYRGSGSLTMRSIYPPDENRITIEVTLPNLDKAETLSKANDEIRTTRELIEMNNSEIVSWSNAMKVKIKKEVENKAIQLKAFYD